MAKAVYRLVKLDSGWGVDHEGGQPSQAYLTKAAALDAAVNVFTQAVNEGHEVHLSVPGGAEALADEEP